MNRPDRREATVGDVPDVQGYLEALLVFMAAARDHLDDPLYAAALPHLEALARVPEPRDPTDSAATDPRET